VEVGFFGVGVYEVENRGERLLCRKGTAKEFSQDRFLVVFLYLF